MRHVAFLRGIGPARKAPGDELRRCFAAAGYGEARPVLATGNVIFAARKAPRTSDLEVMLRAHFGYAVPVILRSAEEIAAMFARDPFRGIDVGRQARFVCMLGDGARNAATPEPPAGAGFRVLGRAGGDLFLVRDNAAAGTPQMMAFLDKAFGPSITTRNWNTMEKIAALL